MGLGQVRLEMGFSAPSPHPSVVSASLTLKTWVLASLLLQTRARCSGVGASANGQWHAFAGI